MRHATASSKALAAGLENELCDLYERLGSVGAYKYDNESAARRRLRNLCLAYLNELTGLPIGRWPCCNSSRPTI